MFLLRRTLGAGSTLIEEMRANTNNQHFNFFRMNSTEFDQLLNMIEHRIIKSDLGREPINPKTRLAVTLR